MEEEGDGGQLLPLYLLAISSGACHPIVPTGEFKAAAALLWLLLEVELRDMDM